MWTRRYFLQSSAALAGLSVYVSPLMATSKLGNIDTVIFKGKYKATKALAIRGKHVVAVGTINDIKDWATPNTNVIDANCI